jgi:hypothetical protein
MPGFPIVKDGKVPRTSPVNVEAVVTDPEEPTFPPAPPAVTVRVRVDPGVTARG